MKWHRKFGGSHVGGGLSKMAKRELLATIRVRYRSSSKKDKEMYPRRVHLGDAPIRAILLDRL